MDTGNMYMVLTRFGVPLPLTTVVSWKPFSKSSLSYIDFHLQNQASQVTLLEVLLRGEF